MESFFPTSSVNDADFYAAFLGKSCGLAGERLIVSKGDSWVRSLECSSRSGSVENVGVTPVASEFDRRPRT